MYFLEEACVKQQNENSETARQNGARRYLQNLTLTSRMEQKSCNESRALEELCETIANCTPQGPRTYTLEEDNIEYLYVAMFSIDWTQSTLKQFYANTPPWKCQQLYIALDSAWLQHQNLKERTLKTMTYRELLKIFEQRYGKAEVYKIPGIEAPYSPIIDNVLDFVSRNPR